MIEIKAIRPMVNTIELCLRIEKQYDICEIRKKVLPMLHIRHASVIKGFYYENMEGYSLPV